jgi:hypothetical protein
MDKHEDAAGLRLVRIGGKGTAWIFTEQAERAQVHSTVWRHGEHAASASTSMSTGTSTGMRVDPAPSPALSSIQLTAIITALIALTSWRSSFCLQVSLQP